MSYYAHTKGNNKADWELLCTHLREVRDLAGEFADRFQSGGFGALLGLRHEWCHPQIPKHTVTEKQAAEKWLREFCLHTGNNYDLLMNQIKNRSEYINVVDDDAQSYYFEHYQDFWKNYTIVTEIYLDENNRPYIRCVC
jgi:hypothetical protein